MVGVPAEPAPGLDDGADLGGREVLEDKALKACGIACLAQREHSRAELRRKLLALALAPAKTGGSGSGRARSAPHPADATQHDDTATRGAAAASRVDAVLDWLEAQRYQSQQRFVESRVRVRSERFGNLRIRQELAQHGLTLPAQTEAALLDSEFERACAVWARKFKPCSSTPADAAKQARFLAGRGFSGEVIRRVLRQMHSAEAQACVAGAGVDEEMSHDARATLPR